MRFAQYLEGFAPAEGLLDLMHTTPVGLGTRILVEGSLRPRACTEYGIDLVYLFYGRPAFKPLPGLHANGMDEMMPMCLVIDPALLGDAIRILPFDSGGYGRYSAHIGPLLTRSDFELGPGKGTPMRLVRAFFETNGNYFRQRMTAGATTIPVSHGEARAFARLANDAALADDDDRRSTIEVQIDRSIPLSSALRAVVGPPSLLSDPEVTGTLASMPSVTQITYETFGRQQPSAYTALLYDHVRRYLVDQGVMA
ncbi:MAG: hypothetical protein PGN12_01780 [Sphingomonas phyllosphaerae]